MLFNSIYLRKREYVSVLLVVNVLTGICLKNELQNGF